MKKIAGIHSAPRPHWVGDGFPVRSLFTYRDHGRKLSPFLLLDYAGPKEFVATNTPRGVGQHPHRGFETVTIVYQGEVAHRDSTGRGGTIGPGDVQWMTAGAGILHDEFHSPAFSRTGGTLELVQLWVNLPAKDKMTAPGYQAILDTHIPVVAMPEGAGSARIIAGELNGHRGPARTRTPMNVWDMRFKAGASRTLRLPQGWPAALAILHGVVQVNGRALASDAQLVRLESSGSNVVIEARSDATALLLSGEPIAEPIVGHGPFVMNTGQEIAQAIEDFNSGKFITVSN
ncbi:MAG TPA: pirin family protein [Spongiibacteraceae bacterium]|nr:pirin family protein [Spongiibacteraceae bacterium]